MLNEWTLRKQICDIGRRMYDAGFVAANDGNMSVRVGNGRFLCTPTGVSKGFLQPADIVVVDSAGRQIDGRAQRTSEIFLHLEIFKACPAVNAVVHAHPPNATAFAVAHVELPSGILPEVELFIGRVPIAPYETPGSEAFARTVLPHLKDKANTIMLANHGAVAFDKDLQTAYFHLETLDMYCRILLLSKQVGRIEPLPADKMRELMGLKGRMGIADPRNGDWAAPCTLAGSDEFLRGFSTRAIQQHAADTGGHGRGNGIAGMPSQDGQPQPLPSRQAFPAVVAGKVLPAALGASSETVRRRAAEDQIEKLVQIITDRIVGAIGRQGSEK